MLAKAPVQVAAAAARVQRQAHPAQLLGHGYGVKRLRWSAHAANHLLSCSYDTSVSVQPRRIFLVCSWPCGDWSWQVRLWDVGGSAQERSCWRHHTEFATGIDWDLFSPGHVVSCGWDNTCVSWDIGV